ncbi:MAG: phytanoyl-CoA dioxygenase family protein [Planctomycetota bacterium]
MTSTPSQPALRPESVEQYLHGDYDRYPVTADEYRHYRQWGFLVVRGLVPADDIAELDEHTQALMRGELPEQSDVEEFDPSKAYDSPEELERAKQRGEYGTSRKLTKPPADLSPDEKAQFFLRIHMLHRQVALHEKCLLHPRLLDVVETLIGPDVSALQSMLFLKPPGKPGQGWHQDAFYIPTFPDTLVGAWIAIDDVDEYNGALWMAKGSASEPVYPPCPGNDAHAAQPVYGFGDTQLSDVHYIRGASEPDDRNTLTPIAEKYDRVLLRMKRGDVAFFNGHVLHQSRDNVTTDRYRRAFVGHYANARSFTQWGHDEEGNAPRDPVTGGTNASHILARGNTHLPFAKPRFGTPCAALLSAEQRRGSSEFIARVMAEHGDGLMGCGIADPNVVDD